MMNTAGAELRKANSRRGFLHPFKSFSTSRVQWRVEPSPEAPDNVKQEAGGSGGGRFLAQLKRSFTLGHRSSSSASASAPSSSSAADQNKYKRSNSVHAGGAWGRRVKQGLSKPLKAVTESYVGCMMGIAEDPRMESLQGMGFRDPSASTDAFMKTSASRRYDRSSSCPVETQRLP